jgi:hypothetical protein
MSVGRVHGLTHCYGETVQEAGSWTVPQESRLALRYRRLNDKKRSPGKPGLLLIWVWRPCDLWRLVPPLDYFTGTLETGVVLLLGFGSSALVTVALI